MNRYMTARGVLGALVWLVAPCKPTDREDTYGLFLEVGPVEAPCATEEDLLR